MPGLSTETAICMINNDILSSRKSTLLMLLDMSAAFDTLNHTILLSRLREIGISGAALEWFTSYIKYRFCNVKVGSSTSTLRLITNGVPQGSVLGPILFNIYIAPIFKLFKNHPKIRFHSFADDLHIYTDAQSPNDSDAHTNLSNCLKDIIEWCNSNSLTLNPGKTQIIFIDPNKKSIYNKHQFIFNTQILDLTEKVHNLGVIFNTNHDMLSFISIKIRNANFHLYRIRKIRKSITFKTCKSIVTSLVLSTLDYCNILLINLTAKDLEPLVKLKKEQLE